MFIVFWKSYAFLLHNLRYLSFKANFWDAKHYLWNDPIFTSAEEIRLKNQGPPCPGNRFLYIITKGYVVSSKRKWFSLEGNVISDIPTLSLSKYCTRFRFIRAEVRVKPNISVHWKSIKRYNFSWNRQLTNLFYDYRGNRKTRRTNSAVSRLASITVSRGRFWFMERIPYLLCLTRFFAVKGIWQEEAMVAFCPARLGSPGT